MRYLRRRSWLVTLCLWATTATAVAQEAEELPDVASEVLPPPSDLQSMDPAGPALNVYGFVDTTYYRPLASQSNPWLQYIPRYPSFIAGNLNVYLDGRLTETLRSLVEVRLLYSPRGSVSAVDPATGVQTINESRAEDPNEPGLMIPVGGIGIQRALLEYSLHRLLSVRVGRYLTPFGIWNVDHGSPTIIGIRQPFILRSGYFPPAQTGVELYGLHETSFGNFGYHLTLGNGGTLADEIRDYDHDTAKGGRLFFERMGSWNAALGMSYYQTAGRFLHYAYTLENGLPRRKEVDDARWDARAIAADLRITGKGLYFQTEWVGYKQDYQQGSRFKAPGMPGKWFADMIGWGGYGLLGYRTPWWGVMPYVTVEYFNENANRSINLVGGDVGHPFLVYVGLNIRAVEQVVVKLELQRGMFLDHGPGSWGEHPITAFQAQVAWVF